MGPSDFSFSPLSPDDIKRALKFLKDNQMTMPANYNYNSGGLNPSDLGPQHSFEIGDLVIKTGQSLDDDEIGIVVYPIHPDHPGRQPAYVLVEMVASSGFKRGENDYTTDVLTKNWQPQYSNTYKWVAGEDIMKQKPKRKSTLKLDESKLDALIIADDTKKEIVAVLKQHEHAAKIFEEWGIGEVIEYGKGMTFMFYGPPGTGKTWAANCMSKAMGCELLIIGAAEIQSQEPGGANRNIQAAFKEAKKGKKILFIDECDSLITSRSDVGMILSSEINTLLTEIEKYEGILILATNRIDTMDEALERRISLIVEFPEPDFDQRRDIWTKLLPKKMPVDKRLTIVKLAEFKLTGGQIKNCILQAARLAVSESADEVGLKHFESAISRVLNSKGLMGSTSRYRQDYVKERGVQKVPVVDVDKGN